LKLIKIIFCGIKIIINLKIGPGTVSSCGVHPHKIALKLTMEGCLKTFQAPVAISPKVTFRFAPNVKSFSRMGNLSANTYRSAQSGTAGQFKV
jgi:hypothetical protein